MPRAAHPLQGRVEKTVRFPAGFLIVLRRCPFSPNLRLAGVLSILLRTSQLYFWVGVEGLGKGGIDFFVPQTVKPAVGRERCHLVPREQAVRYIEMQTRAAQLSVQWLSLYLAELAGKEKCAEYCGQIGMPAVMEYCSPHHLTLTFVGQDSAAQLAAGNKPSHITSPPNPLRNLLSLLEGRLPDASAEFSTCVRQL